MATRSTTDGLPTGPGFGMLGHMASGTGTSSYWRFALPLIALGPLMNVGALAQQGSLLGIPDGVRELAAFAIAGALLDPFSNMLVMVPQMGTVLGKDRSGYRAIKRMIVTLGVSLFAIAALLAITPIGALLISATFAVDDQLVAIVCDYLLWFAMPLPLMGLQKISTGLLFKAGRSGTVSAIRLADVVMVLAILAIGTQAGWSARATLIASRLIPELVDTLATWSLSRRLVPTTDDPDRPHTSIGDALRYFAPLAITTTMFTLSRPILFAMVTISVGAGARSEMLIAAMSIAFSVGFLFQSMANGTLRNLLAAFAKDDPEGCKRFTLQFTVALTAVSTLFLTGPLARWLMGAVVNAEGEVLELACQAAPIMALASTAICWRNWYHGLAMVHHRTGAMAIASLARNLCVGALAAGFARFGLLDHRTGAAIMVAAFACEALVTLLVSRRWRAALTRPGSPRSLVPAAP